MIITAYTDGSAAPNPGPGGWGWYIESPFEMHVHGSTYGTTTTNNRMELTAIIELLLYMGTSTDVELLRIMSDSSYSINGIAKIDAGSPLPVKNRDLFEQLISIKSTLPFPVEISWVKGHSGDPGNDTADELATTAGKWRLQV